VRKQRQERGTIERLAHTRRVLAHCETQMAKQTATRAVISHACEAERMICQVTRAHALNGAGVFADPTARKTDLLSAREAIDRALAAMIAGAWPAGSE